MRRLQLAGALVALATLTACGSATVDNDGPVNLEESIAPLDRGADASETASATSSASASAQPSSAAASSSSATSGRAAAEPAAPAAQDRGARTVTETPTPGGRDATEAKYLDALVAGGVNIEGVEDTLVGAAGAACSGDQVTVPALAGQLIEQGRSQLPQDQLVALIQEQASTAYCHQ